MKLSSKFSNKPSQLNSSQVDDRDLNPVATLHPFRALRPRPSDAAQIAAGVSGLTWQSLAKRNLAVLARVVGEYGRVAHASDQ